MKKNSLIETTSFVKQIMRTIPVKTAALRLFATHHKKHLSKMKNRLDTAGEVSSKALATT